MNYRLKLGPAIGEKYPDYRALIIYAEGLRNGQSDEHSLEILGQAEAQARQTFGESKPAEHPHIATWREAYKSFGAKPSKYPCSVEALLSRTLRGAALPAINRVVDLYNAVSVRYVLPVGGEDWARLTSDLVLAPAHGQEPFDTLQEGNPVVTYPNPGEIVWAESTGVTCRMWNWRQCYRTRLTEETQSAYFVLHRLAPYPLETLQAAGQELMQYLREFDPACTLTSELLAAS